MRIIIHQANMIDNKQ